LNNSPKHSTGTGHWPGAKGVIMGPYEITIKKEFMEEIPSTQVYEKIADTGGDDGGADYGYVEKPAHTKKATETILVQKFDTLNILSILAAVNEATFK